MIDDFITTEALLDKLKAFCTLHSYPLAKQGMLFTPNPDELYLKETFLGDEAVVLGTSYEPCERQEPIYQIDIHTPKGQGGPWPGRDIVNKLKAEFPRSPFILNTTGQTVQVSRVNSRGLDPDKTHNRTVVTVDLIVIASNI